MDELKNWQSSHGKKTRKVRKVIVKMTAEKVVPINVKEWQSIDPFEKGMLYMTGECPNCGQEHSSKIDFFCNKCGAQLDWRKAKV